MTDGFDRGFDEHAVRSGDGTRLRVWRRGSGPAVVFVHGTMSTGADWFAVAAELSTRFRVDVLDRRGRGGSGDGADYGMGREVDDVRSVVQSCDGPVHLVGHSFGAVVALLAAAADEGAIRSLALFEPPIGDGGDEGAGLAAELDRLVAAGRLDDAVATFADAAIGSHDHLAIVSDHVRVSLREAVRHAGREIRAGSAALPLRPEQLERIRVPCLVLLAEDQDIGTYRGVPDLADRLPAGRLERVPGGHLAILSEPAAVASELASFFATMR